MEDEEAIHDRYIRFKRHVEEAKLELMRRQANPYNQSQGLGQAINSSTTRRSAIVPPPNPFGYTYDEPVNPDDYYTICKKDITIKKIIEDNPEIKDKLKEELQKVIDSRFSQMKQELIKSKEAEEYWRNKLKEENNN